MTIQQEGCLYLYISMDDTILQDDLIVALTHPGFPDVIQYAEVGNRYRPEYLELSNIVRCLTMDIISRYNDIPNDYDAIIRSLIDKRISVQDKEIMLQHIVDPVLLDYVKKIEPTI